MYNHNGFQSDVKMGFQARLTEVLRAVGGLNRAAALTDTPLRRLCGYLKRGEIPLKFLHRLAKLADVPLVWLLTGLFPNKPPDPDNKMKVYFHFKKFFSV